MARSSGRFVAVGQSESVVTSLDGIEWHQVYGPSGWRQLRGAARGALQWAAIGWGGLTLSSQDGEQWTPEQAATSKHFAAVAFGADQFIAIGTGGLIARSTCGHRRRQRQRRPLRLLPARSTGT